MRQQICADKRLAQIHFLTQRTWVISLRYGSCDNLHSMILYAHSFVSVKYSVFNSFHLTFWCQAKDILVPTSHPVLHCIRSICFCIGNRSKLIFLFLKPFIIKHNLYNLLIKTATDYFLWLRTTSKKLLFLNCPRLEGGEVWVFPLLFAFDMKINQSVKCISDLIYLYVETFL